MVKFDSPTTIADSNIDDDGSLITLNTNTTISGSLSVTGSIGITDGRIYNQYSNVVSGTTTVFAIQTGSFTSAFFNYTLYDGANARAGIIVSAWNGSLINYNETTTTDIGNTTDATFDMSLSNEGHIQLMVNSTANWAFKTMTTFL